MLSTKFASLSRLIRAVRPEIEKLEARQLFSADPLAYQNVIQTLPYALNFQSAQNGVFDTNGLGTGFTLVQPNKNGTQYQPSLVYLNTAVGELNLTTTGTSSAGSSNGTDNTQVNALETKFSATTAGFSITTRIEGPLTNLTANYENGGVFFGPDQDNYVKLVVGYNSSGGGQTLQFTDEQNATTHTVNTYQGIGSFANIQTLDLRLTGNAGTGTVTASYSVNGAAYVAVSGTVTLSGTEQAAFFNGAGLAGIMASAKNNAAPVTVGFSHFEIDAGTSISGHPSIRYVSPTNGATGVSVSTPIEADLNLPNSAINAQTISNSDVYLYRNSDSSVVPAVVNTSGGGDSIILTPTASLAPNTQYTFVVTSGVADTTGATMVPYQMSFTTGAAVSQVDPNISFTKTDLATATGASFTNVKLGPDGKLYASTEDGRIFRWAVNADGTLGTPTIITSIQTFNGGKRLITGFAFDPASTASNVILWVSNSFYALSGATNGVDFTGKITVLSGPNLATVQDAVTSLPRSVADHSTEQPIFGPGPIAGHNYLYFAQASNTAFGAPDSTWGNRSEHLLTAAVLRLDTSALNVAAGPLNVLTPDAGGTYNPFASGAPLIIYATGVRNAFSLVFTANGDLLAVNNGSSAGGNTPGYTSGASGQVNGNRIDTGLPYSGPNVPSLTNVQQTEDDYLYNITQGGYYGHPNPTRGEYVLDGGNPSSGGVANEVFSAYPVGTATDPNYRGAAWDFGPHVSPDGIIEYQDMTFGGAMQGALIVTEYSAGSDLVTLQRDSAGNVIGETKGIAGFTDLNNPISVAENNANGNLYVAELGGQRIVLLTPVAGGARASVNETVQPFNGVAPGYKGAGVSGAQSIIITNTGSSTLTFPSSNALQVVSDPTAPTADTSVFTITNAASLPTSLAPGASFAVKVTYTAGKTGLQYARLQITSSDPTGPTYVTLRGIGTTGTYGVAEPSLAQVLRSYNIPTIIGAGPNDVNLNTQKYPVSPDATSQEVPMQRLVAAVSNQPVTITPIASFSTNTAAVSRIGYYTPGDPTSLNEMFYIGAADAQTVNPNALGATSFNPGTSVFSIYGTFPGTTTPNGSTDTHYSEDALNTLDPTHARKIRFFPLENPDGSIVPNSYIVAMEDYNDPTTYNSFINFVGIISNVKAASNAINGSTPANPTANNLPVMGVVENQTAPGSTNLVFNRIQNPNSIVPDVVHDTNTITINNTGDQPLVINSLILSDTKNWALVNPPAAGTAIPAGGALTVTIKFIAATDPSHTDNQTNDVQSATDVSLVAAGGTWTGTLTVNSNDPVNPNRVLTLKGYWQIQSEHENEPGLPTITNLLFGYSTNDTGSAATGGTELTNNGNTVINYGSEIDPTTNQGLLVIADTTKPVSLLEAAAFHQQYVTVSAVVGTVGEGVALESEDGNTVTITTAAANKFKIGDSVTINGDLNGYNGTFTITSLPGTNTFTYNDSISDLPDYATAATQPQSGWYQPGGHTHFIYKDQVNNGQSVFPLLTNDSYTTVQTTFTPVGAFGLNLDGQKSQDSANAGNLPFNTSAHGLRFFTAIDGNGNVVPNTYIVGLDYRSYATPNSDYQDLFEIVSNVTFQAMPATPIDLHASTGSTGINLQWAPVSTATGYNVYRSTSVNGTFSLLTTAPITTAGYSDTSAPAGATSYYRITAVNSAGAASVAATAYSISAPAAPSTVTPNPLNSGSIKLTWTASIGTTLYHIEREVVGSGVFTEVGTTTALTYTDTGLTGGTSYAYQIRAENSAGLSPYTTIVSASTPAGVAPGAPSALHATVNSGGAVALTWTAPTTGTVTAYHVEREAQGDSAFTEIAGNVTTASYVDSSVTTGVTYIYRVRAENAGALSGYTSTVTISTGIAPPTGLSAAAVSTTEIDLSWMAASGTVSQYHIERQDPNTLAWSQIGVTTALTYQDTGLPAGISYNYRVRSDLSGTYSAYAGPVNAGTPTSAPAAPATASATATSSAQVTLNWSAVTGAASYIIQRQAVGTSAWTTVSGAYTGGTTLVDSISPNTSYVYQVAAQNAAGASGFTASQSVTTVASTYSSADIASTPAGGTVVNTDGVSYDVTGYGSDIGSTNTDGFRFVYKQVSGNFDAVVEINSLTNTFSTAKAGLMVRSTLDADSAMVFDGATATSSFRWLYRSAANATANFASVGSTVAYPNVWVRLKRVGNVFTGYYSTDGLTWTQSGTVTLALPTSLYFGMAVTSHNTSAAATAQFRHLSVLTPPASPLATATATSTSAVTVSWSSVPSATSYSVLRLNIATNTYATIATGLTGTSYIDSSLSPSTNYTYEVTATNSVGTSPAGISTSATTQANASAPSTPTGLTGTSPSATEIDLSWSAAGGATSYTVQRSSGGSAYTSVATNITTTTFHDTTVAAGTSYQYQVISNNGSGSSGASAALSISSQAAAAATFNSADIGSPLPGSTTTVTNDRAYNVTAGGTGIYNNADSFRFVYTQVTGNFDIAVQVTSLSAVTGAYAQAGLVARSTLDAASPDVGITASPSGGYRFKYRGANGAATTQTQTATSVSAAFPNAWVRLKRVGNLFTTYYSTNGSTWTTLGSVTMTALSATTPIYVGMAVASNSATGTTTAAFANFTGA